MAIQGLNTAYTGIRAAQAAIETISHNIANMSVEGYTRQRVELGSVYPFESPVGLIGTGVDVMDIHRTRERLLDERTRAESGRLGYFESRFELLSLAEDRLGQLDNAIDSALTEVFSQLEDLAMQPDSAPIRTAVLGSMEALATRMRETVSGITQLRTETLIRIDAQGRQFNDTIAEIARLNGEIAGLSGAGAANDLQDQRDILIDQLSRGLGVRTVDMDNGMVRVSLNGLSLVDGKEYVQLGYDPITGAITHPDVGGNPVMVGGEIGGLKQFLDQDLVALLARFDTLASDIATEFNAQNALGIVQDGVTPNAFVTGGDLFDASGGAAAFNVVATAGREIAAALPPAGFVDGDVIDPPPSFDGRNVQALADLRTKVLLDGRTLNEQFRDLVANHGVLTRQAAQQTVGQDVLHAATNRARENQHGVDLNEELTLMIAHQRALEASSRVLTTMDEVLSTLIHSTGIVGR